MRKEQNPKHVKSWKFSKENLLESRDGEEKKGRGKNQHGVGFYIFFLFIRIDFPCVFGMGKNRQEILKKVVFIYFLICWN